MAKSQKDLILQHLIDGYDVTPIDALTRFRCFRLSARIEELRRDGHPIETGEYELPGGKKVARYYLVRQTHRRTHKQKTALDSSGDMD